LRDQCLGCHKPGKAKGGLLLTSREKILTGGDNGAAMVPGKAEGSMLYEQLLEDADPHMPPKKQLSKTEIAAVKAWINAGAAWDYAVFDELPTVKPVALSVLPKDYQPVLALALSPKDDRIAIARGSVIAVHDLTKPERPLLTLLTGPKEPVQSLAWTPDGKLLLSGGFREIRLWDAAALKETGVIADRLVGNLTALVISADNRTIFVADGEPGGPGFIHRIDLTEKKIMTTWKAHEDSIYALRLSPDGKSLASASADKLAKLWKVADGKLISFYEGHTSHVLGVAFNKDATQLATAGADREVKVWDVKSREQDVSLGDKKTVFSGLTWTPNGQALIAVTDKGGGSVYSDLKKHSGEQRTETAKEVKLTNVGVMLYTVVATADAKTIFAGGDSGCVYLWDDKGKPAGKLEPAK
jgi:WD40 repeat protein